MQASVVKPATVVTCVEHGPLETQVLRMLESLRRWGGRLAHADVRAITPRLSIPVSRHTRRELDRLAVTYSVVSPPPDIVRYTWYPFLNKAVCLNHVEHFSDSDVVIWLDADVLVIGEPEQMLRPDAPDSGDFGAAGRSGARDNWDLAAAASDKNVGSAGPGDPCEPYWRRLCAVLGVDIERLPWVTVARERRPIRLYYNGGVFAYRRSTGFAKRYLRTCVQLLDARFALHRDGVFFHEQAALGLVAHQMGLHIRDLPLSHNQHIGGAIGDIFSAERLRAARVIHYHSSMWPEYWPTFCNLFREVRPDVHEWMQTLTPLSYRPAPHVRLMNLAIKRLRSARQRAYLRQCELLPLHFEVKPTRAATGATTRAATRAATGAAMVAPVVGVEVPIESAAGGRTA